MRAGVERALSRYTLHIDDVDVDVDFEVELAETGEDAIEIIDTRQPDILLLDYMLPGISGLDVLERIGRREGMYTVIISAFASLEAAVTAIKRGAYDFLAKPFTPQELKATVRKVTESLVHAREARKLAEERRKVRFQFIRVLAHELKAPINAVEGFLTIVRDRTAGDNEEAYEDMVCRSIDRIQSMRKLIMDLLDLTRIESGEKVREIGPVDLREAVDRAVESASPEAEDRGIEIHVDAPPSIPMTGDSGELEIILNNLVSNAVKYNRDNGRVDVKVDLGEDRVRIDVADTGIGMTKDEAEKLFNDFVRIKNEKTRRIPGSGLGLSIIKKLSELYGGGVGVQSEPDKGSTFTVELERHSDASAHAEEEPAPAPETTTP
jgi:signal transduction histidine kinase